MSLLTSQSLDGINYSRADGEPMAESDPTRDYLIYAVEALDIHFQSRKHVYVSGALPIFYRKGDRSAVVSPDVFVIFGVSKRKRERYLLWEEGNKVPAFILEITSAATQQQDEVEKPRLYASLGVQEYFQYDPIGDYLKPQLKGLRLANGRYQFIPTQVLSATKTEGPDVLSIHSRVLGLDLRLQDPIYPGLVGSPPLIDVPRGLRFYDPQTEEKLLSHRESEEARESAEQLREQAEQARIQAEQARVQAEQALLTAIPRLLKMGLTAEQIAEALSVSVNEVKQISETKGRSPS
ncbi:MAG: Uma2 family endonuclease [Cyanobacteria bacterium CRU_2_1]|nr:Uma2 family endonuclease [Cyanobacteria bacterium RU_5_0]NJR59300.1 Uma2 family endonuclease [Cyanobacteria bacterium CRU_2_1]